MRGRFLAVMLTLLVTFDAVGEAQAHRLAAACRFFPRRMVRVESWFDNGETPKSGQVEVSDEAGEVLVKGRLSSQGLFLFDAPAGQPLRVVVEAGEGHRAEVAIGPEELIVAQAAEEVPGQALPAPAADPAAPASRAESFPLKDVLTGIGLLLAVAALALSLRNARTIRELRKVVDPRGSATRG
jgi:nickel transport protein